MRMFTRNNSMYDVATFYKFLFHFWGTKSPKLVRLFRSYDKVSEKICGAISKFSINLFSNFQWISAISFCWQSLIVTNYIDSLFLTSILLLLDCHVIGFYDRNRVYVVFGRDRCFVDVAVCVLRADPKQFQALRNIASIIRREKYLKWARKTEIPCLDRMEKVWIAISM